MPEHSIAHYQITRRLGSGGMGEVFLAQDSKLGRAVALKVMSPEMAKDPKYRKRFQVEARAASALTHPNICAIHEIGETVDGRPFLAMEYVEGETLDQILLKKRFRIRDTLEIGIQVAEALEEARARGIVHRDIKPANIMLDTHGRVRVLDFGLAKSFGPDDIRAEITTAITRTGFLVGTPQYMSPEQALGRELDHRSDLFSLGVVLYELIVGQRPFLCPTLGETINNLVNQRPQPLGLENPAISPSLDNVIFKCLEKDPANRYASGNALAQDLRQVKAGLEQALVSTAALEGARTSPAPRAQVEPPTRLWQLTTRARGSSKPLLAAIGVGVGLVIVFLGWQTWHKRAGNPNSHVGTRSAIGQLASSDEANPLGTVDRSRLVLLPLKSLSAAEDNEVFTEGLAVELVSKLGRISGLTVIDGSAFVRSSGADRDYASKWRELRAGSLLRGTVLREQKQVRIRLQLLDSQSQEVRRTFDYDRELESVLSLETEAAEAIANALQVQLLADDRLRLARLPTPNPAAYQAFLQGRAFWNRVNEPGWRRSIALFKEAVELDPRFAEAYAGIADSYVQLSFDFMRPTEAFALAKTNAQQALVLQPDLAEPYVSRAQCRMCFDRDYAGAREDLEVALRLNPRYAETFHFYAHLNEMLGQMTSARTMLERARAHDPLSLLIPSEMGWAAYHARQYARGIEQCQSVLNSDPTFDYARWILGINQVESGQCTEAAGTLKKAWAGLGFAATLGDLGYALARAGRTTEANECLEQLRALQAKETYVPLSAYGFVCLGLGQTDTALDWFERAVEQHDAYMAWAKVEPRFDPLHGTPRFKALVKTLRLPE